jgi:hypothetical protein
MLTNVTVINFVCFNFISLLPAIVQGEHQSYEYILNVCRLERQQYARGNLHGKKEQTGLGFLAPTQ